MNIRNSASVQLQGQLKAGALADFLAQVPKDATVTLTETRGDQRDPGYFTLTAAWSGAAR